MLSAQFRDTPSVYAEEGAFLHELCELKLHRYLGDMTEDLIGRQYADHRDSDEPPTVMGIKQASTSPVDFPV